MIAGGGVVVTSDGTLFLPDYTNNLILILAPTPPTSNGMPAFDLIGQPDFTTITASAALDAVHVPFFLQYDDDH